MAEKGRISEMNTAIRRGRDEGREEGREEGRKEGLLLAARNMREQGLPVDMIVKATGLSEGEIAEL